MAMASVMGMVSEERMAVTGFAGGAMINWKADDAMGKTTTKPMERR